jgi:hypothetical protein
MKYEIVITLAHLYRALTDEYIVIIILAKT